MSIPFRATHTADDGRYYMADGCEWFFANSFGHWKRHWSGAPTGLKEIKPAKKQWSGPQDGLPPVGIKVDYMGDHCTVVAHVNKQGKKGAILQGDEDWFYGSEATIDPIKTPEQLAAEERERAVSELAEVLARHVVSPLAAAYAMYDAGFKREVK